MVVIKACVGIEMIVDPVDIDGTVDTVYIRKILPADGTRHGKKGL